MASKKKSTPSAASEPEWVAVERALKIMERHHLEEFEYSDGAFHVRLKKPSTGAPLAVAVPTAPAEIAASAPAPAPAAPSEAPAPAAAAEPEENLHIVKSPIVGTYYSASSPGAPAFVRVGDHVQSGQVLCIIEAMKLMNEIESEAAGEIARVFVENGQPVEYGEPLFAIRPSGPARSS